MRASSLVLPVVIVTVAGIIGLGAVRAFDGSSDSGQDAELVLGENRPGAFPYDDAQVEQTTGIIYPYAVRDTAAGPAGEELEVPPAGEIHTTLTGSAAPAFSAPDQALLDEASSLACPYKAVERSVPELFVVLCVPPGWEVEIGPAGGASLTREADLGPLDVRSSEGLVIAFLALGTRETFAIEFPPCAEPGSLALDGATLDVCFYTDQIFEDGAATLRTRGLIASTPGAPSIWVTLLATRIGDDAPITLADAAFREAFAILANLRFE